MSPSPAGGLPAGLSDFRLPLDEPLMRLLNGLSSPAVDAMTTWLGRPIFDWAWAAIAMLGVIALLRRQAIGPLIGALGATGLTDLIGARLLKPGFHRMRPFDALPGTVHQAFPASHLGSMPSLHAANAFAMAAVLSWAAPRLSPLLYGFASLVALSRVVGGVHWPSDVVAGALLGSAVGLAACWVLRRIGARGAPGTAPIPVP
jgi:undecaprenyl-diphosphatase